PGWATTPTARRRASGRERIQSPHRRARTHEGGRRMKRTCLALAAALLASTCARAEPTLKALIIDGQDNLTLKVTTLQLKKILEDTAMFNVVVATSLGHGQDMSGFKPNFKDCAVVVSNYNGEEWSKETKRAFVDYVKNGGGFVPVHAANNSF